MKTSKIISVLILLTFFLGINSCKKDEIKVDEPLCTPTSDYYFIANIGDESKCWNEGEDNSRFRFEWTEFAVDSISGISYITIEMDHTPTNYQNRESIQLSVQIPYQISELSYDQFLQIFQPGTHYFCSFNERNTGLGLRYYENGKYYFGGEGDYSYLECTNVSVVDDVTNALDVTYFISSKLYDENHILWKEIKQSKMKFRIIYPNK